MRSDAGYDAVGMFWVVLVVEAKQMGSIGTITTTLFTYHHVITPKVGQEMGSTPMDGVWAIGKLYINYLHTSAAFSDTDYNSGGVKETKLVAALDARRGHNPLSKFLIIS